MKPPAEFTLIMPSSQPLYQEVWWAYHNSLVTGDICNDWNWKPRQRARFITLCLHFLVPLWYVLFRKITATISYTVQVPPSIRKIRNFVSMDNFELEQATDPNHEQLYAEEEEK
jgi:hypothetical protein